MNNFLDNFYGVLFSPDETFDKLKENPPFFQGFLIILFVSILSPLLNFKGIYGTSSLILFIFGLMGAIFISISSWLSFAFFLEILASIFKQSGKFKEFLTLSAFALIPWLFLGPVELFKTGGIIGKLFGIVFGLIIWLWIIVLVIKAVMKTYQLSFGRVLLIIILPSLGNFLAFYWFITLFSTLFQIFKS